MRKTDLNQLQVTNYEKYHQSKVHWVVNRAGIAVPILQKTKQVSKHLSVLEAKSKWILWEGLVPSAFNMELFDYNPTFGFISFFQPKVRGRKRQQDQQGCEASCSNQVRTFQPPVSLSAWLKKRNSLPCCRTQYRHWSLPAIPLL